MAVAVALVVRSPDGFERCQAILDACRETGAEIGVIDEAGRRKLYLLPDLRHPRT